MWLSPVYGASSRAEDGLGRLLAELRRAQRGLPLCELTSLVLHARLSAIELEAFLTLEDAAYAHREVFRSPYVEVGCIGWRRGQRTPIHDHADSVCAVLVLDGVLTNTEYHAVAPARIVRGVARRVSRGETLGFERGAIHRMANEQLDALFTLHVYSPPLTPMPHRIRPEASVCSRSAGGTP